MTGDYTLTNQVSSASATVIATDTSSVTLTAASGANRQDTATLNSTTFQYGSGTHNETGNSVTRGVHPRPDRFWIRFGDRIAHFVGYLGRCR